MTPHPATSRQRRSNSATFPRIRIVFTRRDHRAVRGIGLRTQGADTPPFDPVEQARRVAAGVMEPADTVDTDRDVGVVFDQRRANRTGRQGSPFVVTPTPTPKSCRKVRDRAGNSGHSERLAAEPAHRNAPAAGPGELAENLAERQHAPRVGDGSRAAEGFAVTAEPARQVAVLEDPPQHQQVGSRHDVLHKAPPVEIGLHRMRNAYQIRYG